MLKKTVDCLNGAIWEETSLDVALIGPNEKYKLYEPTAGVKKLPVGRQQGFLRFSRSRREHVQEKNGISQVDRSVNQFRRPKFHGENSAVWAPPPLLASKIV